VFKKLSVRLACIIILTMVVLLVLFTAYLTGDRAAEAHRLLMEKGVTCAKTGAAIMGRTFESINDNGFFTLQEIFDFTLEPIALPEWIEAGYASASPKDRDAARKYHYASALDSYLDIAVLEIQDQFLEDPQVIYAALLDKRGYLPTHNSKYSESLTGDFTEDLKRNRTKRVYTDRAAVRACTNTADSCVVQEYKRDTGETMLDFGAPVFVKGRHWGVFRIGFSMRETEASLAALRRKILLMMGTLTLVLAAAVGQLTALMMKPLRRLSQGVAQVARGDLSFRQPVTSRDEIGDLARAFNKMVSDLNTYIQNLTETTAAKEKIESELRIAHDIQMGILPKIFPPFPQIREIDLHAVIHPAKEVGGDFYDFFMLDDDWLCLVIGDVSGKGVPASLLMAVTITLLRAKSGKTLAPDEVLRRVNADLCADNENHMFVTLFLGVLNVRTGELAYCNCGHNLPYRLSADGRVVQLEKSRTLALGFMPDFPYETRRLSLGPGEGVVLYTDGVTEAMDASFNEFNEERLERSLARIAGGDAEAIDRWVVKDVRAFVGDAPQSDDIAMLTLRYRDA
jgi:serine phosphatase RsbU (regulator of sigma subunit)/HAMP domain-containing protein